MLEERDELLRLITYDARQERRRQLTLADATRALEVLTEGWGSVFEQLRAHLLELAPPTPSDLDADLAAEFDLIILEEEDEGTFLT